jgi:hypothetical protein
MKIVRFCLLLAMIVCRVPVQAQDTDNIPWYGRLAVGFGHDDVRNVDIGLLSVIPSLEGLQVGLIAGGVHKSMSGVGIYGIVGATSEDANGVQIAGINFVRQRMHGLAIGGICIAGEGMHGMQIGGVNMACLEMKGVQLGFLNDARNYGMQVGVANMTGDNAGVSIGGINLELGHNRGLQLGGENFADSLSGVQIGVLNQCRNSDHGVQIGIFNYCAEECRQFGLVNVNQHSRLQMLVTTGNQDLVNLALRIRNRHTYNVIGFGIGRKGWDDYSCGSAYYRIGQYFTILPRLTLSGDVGIADVAVLRKGTDAPNMFSLEARMNVEYEVHSKVSLFATVGYSSTRYVSDGKQFRHKPLFELGVALF